jgi:hypothetical protein
MKTFREFILEAQDTVKDATYTGDTAEQERIRQRERARGFDPDAERDAARKKAREELLRKKTVSGEDIRGKSQTPSQPSGGIKQTQAPSRQPSGGGIPPRPGAMVQSPGGKLVKSTVKAAAGGATQGAAEVGLNVAKGVKTSTKIPGLKSGAALGAVLGTADEKMKGSGWARSLARGATVAAGSVLGGLAGGVAGTAIAPGAGTAIGGYAGQAAGGAAADKAFDTVAGANAVQRKAIATTNRKSQAGGAIKGIGGKTTFDTKKNTITTGTGAQRKTAQLGKTSVVTDPKTGKQEVGNLAYKGGKAVYKRSDTKSLAQTSSNPLERIGRSLFAGAYKQSDAANAAKKLAAARQSDASRNKALGVKFGPGK